MSVTTKANSVAPSAAAASSVIVTDFLISLEKNDSPLLKVSGHTTFKVI